MDVEIKLLPYPGIVMKVNFLKRFILNGNKCKLTVFKANLGSTAFF